MASSTKQFDVVFIQMLPMYECYLPIAKALRVPVIATLSFRPWADVDREFGNPHPYVYPHITMHVNQTRMTFWERCRNVYNHLVMSFVYGFLNQHAARAIYDQFQLDYDLTTDKRLSLLFSNNHPSIFPKAIAPNVIEIGGVHIKPSQPLPSVKIESRVFFSSHITLQRVRELRIFLFQNLKNFIDQAENGVIIVSLGTIAGKYTIDTELINVFTDAFAEIPQRVIWKFDDQVEDLPSNVLLTRWMPQRDILGTRV